MVGEKIERGGEIRWLVVTGHRMLLLARLIRSVEVVEFGRKVGGGRAFSTEKFSQGCSV